MASREEAIAELDRRRLRQEAIAELERRDRAPQGPGVGRAAAQGAIIEAPGAIGSIPELGMMMSQAGYKRRSRSGLSRAFRGSDPPIERPPLAEIPNVGGAFEAPGRYVMEAATGEAYIPPETDMEKMAAGAARGAVMAAPALVMGPGVGALNIAAGAAGEVTGEALEARGVGTGGQIAGASAVDLGISAFAPWSFTRMLARARGGPSARTARAVADELDEAPVLKQAMLSDEGADVALDETRIGYQGQIDEAQGKWNKYEETNRNLKAEHPGITTSGHEIIDETYKLVSEPTLSRAQPGEIPPVAKSIMDSPETVATMTIDEGEGLLHAIARDQRKAYSLTGEETWKLAGRLKPKVLKALKQLARDNPEAGEAVARLLSARRAYRKIKKGAPRRGAKASLYRKWLDEGGDQATTHAGDALHAILSSSQPEHQIRYALEISGPEGRAAWRRAALDWIIEKGPGVGRAPGGGMGSAEKAAGKLKRKEGALRLILGDTGYERARKYAADAAEVDKGRLGDSFTALGEQVATTTGAVVGATGGPMGAIGGAAASKALLIFGRKHGKDAARLLRYRMMGDPALTQLVIDSAAGIPAARAGLKAALVRRGVFAEDELRGENDGEQ